MGRSYPLTWAWRSVFLFASGVGLAAVAVGLAGLLDLPLEFLRDDATSSSAELVVALVVGLALQPFALTGLCHGRAGLDRERLTYLGLGVLCRPKTIPLAEIARFGTGVEKRGHRRDVMLVLEGHDGRRRSIKVSMYADWRELVAALGEALGKEPSDTKDGLLGVDMLP